MKKNININISGIIFNIEEDGYDRLKHYLDEIKRYFATYDDTGEIAADIENRVSEIFLTKLNPHKQVITSQDVDSLIAQMGNVQDFEAIEEREEATTDAGSYGRTYTASGGSASAGAGPDPAYHANPGTDTHTATGSADGAGAENADGTTTAQPGGRRLYRHGKRKIIGGVASGIAHYLRIDAFWVRLVFLIILLDLFISFSFSSALVIGYIIFWIVVPERFDLPEDRKIKKMFRNPDDKVLGGVASGLAAYFGVDPSLIRILFVLLMFVGGSSLLAYIILWIITPEAVTLTDRMQMQGEPVTLSNIEHNVKKNLNVKEGEEETTLVKVLLFPFRLISAIFSGTGRTLAPLIRFLGEAIRIIAGIALILGGFFIMLGLIAGLSFGSGFFPEVYLELFDLELPAVLAQKTIPALMLIAGFIAMFIPTLMFMLMGASIIAKRWVLNTAAGWMLFAFWIISLITLAFTVPQFVMDYRVEDYYETENTFPADSSQTIFLGLPETDRLDYNDVALTIKATPENEMRLEQRFHARGRDRDAALELARLSSYDVRRQGDSLLMSQHLSLPDDVPYRGQKLEATLYMPIGQPFRMDYSMRKILSYTLTPFGFSASDLREAPVFVFNENSELECPACPQRTQNNNNRTEPPPAQAGDFSRDIIATDFKEVTAGSHYEVVFTQSDQYSIRLQGSKDAVNMVEFDQQGEHISFKNSLAFNSSKGKVIIYISMPELHSLNLSGRAMARFDNWSGQEMDFDLSGASECVFNGEVNEVNIDMSGSSQISLSGIGKQLQADISGSSEINAMDFSTQEARLGMSGATQAAVAPQEQLTVNASGASQVRYKGNPKTNITKGRAARVQKSDD